MSKIKAMIKNPGESWEAHEIDNTLKAMQAIVGGYIEVVNVRDDLVLIVNEEGILHEMESNLYVRGCWIRGTVIAVGVDGENFTDCPLQRPWEMRIAIGIANARK